MSQSPARAGSTQRTSPTSGRSLLSSSRYSPKEVVEFELHKTIERKSAHKQGLHDPVVVSQQVGQREYQRRLASSSPSKALADVPLLKSADAADEALHQTRNFYSRRPTIDTFHMTSPITHEKKVIRREDLESTLPVRSAWRLVGGESPAKEYQAERRTATVAVRNHLTTEATGLQWEARPAPEAKGRPRGEFSSFLNASLSSASGHPFIGHRR